MCSKSGGDLRGARLVSLIATQRKARRARVDLLRDGLEKPHAFQGSVFAGGAEEARFVQIEARASCVLARLGAIVQAIDRQRRRGREKGVLRRRLNADSVRGRVGIAARFLWPEMN